MFDKSPPLPGQLYIDGVDMSLEQKAAGGIIVAHMLDYTSVN